MMKVLNRIKRTYQSDEIRQRFLDGKFGIEKENLRVDAGGNLSLIPHPDVLGDKNDHPYITTDFSESQVEMITPPMNSVHEALGMLETIHDIVSENIGDELLWPQSLPPNLPEEEKIPIASYGEKGRAKEIYRELLAEVYGRERQLISGIHFNFSFPDQMLGQLMRLLAPNQDFELFREEVYLRMVRNFMRYRWLLVWLMGESPVAHDGFKVKSLKTGEQYPIRCRNGMSIRTSPGGYRNREALYPDYSSVKAWKQSVQFFIDEGKLSDEKELYMPIRLKFEADSTRISHLEVRIIDLDPFEKIGVREENLHFVHLFLLFCLFVDEADTFRAEQQKLVNSNQDIVSCHGLCETVSLITFEGDAVQPRVWAGSLLEEMEQIFSSFGFLEHPRYHKAMKLVRQLVEDTEMHPAQRLLREIDEQGFIEFHMRKAKDYKALSLAKGFCFYGFEDMELSTQMLLKEAVRRGIDFEILDRKENFVRLTKDGRNEYVMQATRTSLDNYSSVLMMENKLVTKKVLKEYEIRVPGGGHYTKAEEALLDFLLFENRPIVVKPKSTNFGIGITILKENNDYSVFKRAVEIAFEQDDSILIEGFEEGREFRFFVINDDVVGILHRVPANVKGDGVCTITELVQQKNQDPLRGKGYRTPLEKIALGEAEEMFLKSQNLDFNSIPGKDEVVYLRENSNISTGGDSIDYTDEIHPSYKKIAVRAAQALDVKITGLDMMIPDIKIPAAEDNYAIIEMNFNPAIHIHCFPYLGKNRKLNQKILDALGF
ncbi:MAG: bifunctional glutamate--cysteine ligase GshA/glutathione synthetase GshB [Marinifilaceae bacterium]